MTAVLGIAPEAIERAAALIRAGGLVAFPTETVYGLGADALNAVAVSRIFTAKGRPAYDPLIVHLADSSELARVAREVPALAYTLAERFWPGPLTLVLPRSAALPPVVTAGGETVAVRVPAHPVALALIRAAGVPIAAPSANRFGKISPTCAAHVLADLEGRIDALLDGGETHVGVESTVLSLVTPVPTILRPGGVSRETLVAALGEVAVLQQPVHPAAGDSAPAPGTLAQHYAPRAALRLYQGAPEACVQRMLRDTVILQSEGARVGLLLADEDLPQARADVITGIVVQTAGPAADLAEVARRLYAALRALDQAGVSVILARDFGALGLGLAIRDRLTRAAGGCVIEL